MNCIFYIIIYSWSGRICGEIDYCTSYIENNCNTCYCDSNGIESCTDNICSTIELEINKCETCIDGYTPSDDKLSCEFSSNCICTTEYAPVCCNDYTYSNSCFAKYSGSTDDQTTDGKCIKTCDDVTCELGEKCAFDPTNGGRCVDENICCDPQYIKENARICFEGFHCCLDGMDW